MSSERTPLIPRPTLQLQRAQYSQSESDVLSSVNENDLDVIRVHRRTVYCLIGYALLASVLLLASLPALLLSNTSGWYADGSAGQQQPMEHMQPPSPPKPSDPASPSLHGPLPARRSWNKSHLAHFLLLTDIHLEPHYNATQPNARYGVCRDEQHLHGCLAADWKAMSTGTQSEPSSSNSFFYGRYLCDPPHSFVSAALQSLATSLALVPLDVILLPGDLAAHFVACPRTLYSTVSRTLSLVTTAFPSIPVIFSIGNTDIFPTSSLPSLHSEPATVDTAALTSAHSACQTAFFPLLDLLLLHGVLDEADDDDAIQTFCHGGYYSKRISNGRIRILSLNTIAWSQQLLDSTQSNPSHTSGEYSSNLEPANSPVPCDERPDDPFGQFGWLEHEVRAADESGQHLWLLGHIPPGVKADEQGWCWRYWQRMERLLQDYKSVITQLHFGDYSQDSIRLVERSDTVRQSRQQQQSSHPFAGGVSHVVHINPGLSPRKNVNPAARVYTYNQSSSHLVDYQQLYIDLTRLHTAHSQQPPHWLFQYNALDAYAMDEYGPAGWLDVVRRMRWTSDGVPLERYMRGVNVWKAGVGDGLSYLCDVMAMGLADNRRCKQTGVVPGLEEVHELDENGL